MKKNRLRFMTAWWRLFYPPVCPGCLTRLACTGGDGWCSTCLGRLPPLPDPRCTACGGAIDGVLDMCSECLVCDQRPWRHAVSVFAYGGYVRELIHRFKYRGATMFAPLFARQMTASWLRFAPDAKVDVVVPLPLHPVKEFTRGYNQSRLLGQVVSRGLQRPLGDFLQRPHWSRPQAQLSLMERQTNVRNVFQISPGVDLEKLDILLIDDVFTTGATFAAATETLKKSKVASIKILSLARG